MTASKQPTDDAAYTKMEMKLKQMMPDHARQAVEQLKPHIKSLITSQVKEALRTPYRERAQLVAVLSKLYPSHLCVDDNEPDWIICCIHIPVEEPTVYGDARNSLGPCYQTVHKQAGWHISARDRNLFNHLKVEPNHYDGHTTEEKYKLLADIEANLDTESNTNKK